MTKNLHFFKIWLGQSLDIMVGYHYEQYHKKLTIQSRENLAMGGGKDRHTNKSDGHSSPKLRK